MQEDNNHLEFRSRPGINCANKILKENTLIVKTLDLKMEM